MKKQSYAKINKYILDNIDGTGYGREFKSNKDKLQFVFDTFKSECGYNIKQVGQLKALQGWLKGLPSAVDIEWRNHLILELGEKWNLIDPTASKTKKNNFLNNWFAFMAMRIIELWKRNSIGSI